MTQRPPKSTPARLALLGSTLAWCTLFSADVWAGRKPTVAVVGPHLEGQDEAASLQNLSALAAAIEAAGRLDALEPVDVRRAVAGREDLVLEGAFLGPGRQRLAEGRVLYERAEFEAAVEPLEGAVDALRSATLRTRETKDLLDSLLLLGLTHFSLGDEAAAAEAWGRLVVLDPARQLDAVNYPPKVVKAFGDVRAELFKEPRGSIRLNAPEGASLFVDGRATGVDAADLVPGEHYVLVVAPDGRREGAVVEVLGLKRANWTPELANLRVAEPGATEAERRVQSGQLYGSLGEHAGADFVLIAGSWGEGKVGLQLFEPSTGNFSKLAESSAGGDPMGALLDVVPSLMSFVDEAGALRGDRVLPSALPIDISTNPFLTRLLLDPEPMTETVTVTRRTPWYVWAGVAAVAAGGAATLAVVLSKDEPTPAGEGGGDGGEVPDPVDPNQGSVVLALP